MKKLILVAVLLVAVLLLSWWAKSANFSPFAMMQSFQQVKGASTQQTTATVAQSPTPIPVEIIITVTPNGFVPDVIMISPGTKITWINKTPNTANISSDPQDAYQQLNLGDFGENGSVSQTFPTAGRYHYDNGKNPVQKGVLVVK